MNKTKILIVDDNEVFLALLNDFLIQNEYDVLTSSNGLDAKKINSDFNPDIVITDVVMPGIDGIELLMSLRNTNPNVKVIVMSGGNKGHADTYLLLADKLGANLILNKPFELSSLLIEIKKLEDVA